MNKCKICKADIPQKRIYCSNACKFSDSDYNKKRSIKTKINSDITVAVCNLCDSIFKDVNNVSGVLTKHLATKHGLPFTTFDANFKIEINSNANISKWECPMCDWNTTDTKNKSGCITIHVKNQHNMDIDTFINQYPAHAINSKKHKLIQKHTHPDDYVLCKICKQRLSIISNTHCLNMHGITQEEYKQIYGDDIISKTMADALKKAGGSKSFVSKGETEILEFLQSAGVSDVIHSYHNGGFEIDVYSPSMRIGVEYNGLYWHSELRGRGDKYHIQKTEYFEGKDIRLIHIFEDEWLNKQDIIKHKLLHIFKKADGVKIPARKCYIEVVSKADKAEFLNSYHLQGNDKSSICYGLYWNNVLVSVMTFSKKRLVLGYANKSDNEYELVRYATNHDYIVQGGFSKLLKHFVRNDTPKKIVTYADRRFSVSDSVYVKAGFTFAGNTRPNYFYMQNHKQRLHRFGFTKHRILEMGGDPNITEWENMVNFGYDRIWDCGSFKYTMTFD